MLPRSEAGPGAMPGPVRVHVPSGAGVRGRMTGAQAAVAALCAEGTRCVFGVPGAQNNELWDTFKAHGLPYLLVGNEFSASIMADGAARATGGVGVFAVVPGPGLTNSLTGIGEALYDSVPIVGIVTDIDRRPDAPVGQVHGLPNAAILRPVCKAVIEVRHQGQIPGAIGQAFRTARCGEPGPAAVVIPYNFYNEVWDYDEPPPAPAAYTFDEDGYRRAVGLLADRRLRVGIYAGIGCLEAGPSLRAVAETMQAPVATSVSGKGAIDEAHPLAVGWGYGPQATRAAELTFRKDVDLVLAVGVRYSENSTANYNIPRHAKLIHVDANPANLGKNVPADVAVCADGRAFLDRLQRDAKAVCRPPRPELWRAIAQRKEVDRCWYEKPIIMNGVDPMYFLATLRRVLGPDEILAVDVTASVHWAAEAFEVRGPRRFFTPANNQGMGWAVPAAIGAQRVRPDRQVVAVVGDGCFLMSGLEVATAAREGLPVKFFVLDDGAYHYMQMLQEPTYRRTTATDIARLDFAALAKGLGVAYQCIGRNDEVAAGVRNALAHPGPVLSRVVVSYDGREIRWLNALKSSYIDGLTTKQKVRMATRVAVRSLDPTKEND
jgi:acetolactate synthase-1/2/3 large subunit